MITIKNVRTLDDQITDYTIPSSQEDTIEAKGKLLLLPGVVDSHICFGSMNQNRQKWDSAISSAIRGGITTAIEISNQEMPCNNRNNLEQKSKMIDERLAQLNIPLRYFLYSRADLGEIAELGLSKKFVKGVVIQLDPSKKEELDSQWEKVFQMAAWEDLPIIVNAHNENTREEFKMSGNHKTFLDKAIYYAERQNTRLYVLNVSTQQEIDLIQEGRRRSLLIYAETTPQHLFQEKSSQSDCLWKALNEGIIEIIGSGFHAEQSNHEKVMFRGNSFSLSNPNFLLPLLFTSHLQGKISIEKIVRLLSFNIHDIFDIKRNQDAVLIDLEKEEAIQHHGMNVVLKGWPAYTIVQGQVFNLDKF